MQELNGIYTLYKEEKISSKEAVKEIMDKVFRQKQFFGLNKLEEDSLSDFIVYFYPQVEHFMKLFDESKSSFSTYLYGVISSNLQTWYRIHYKNKAQDMALKKYAIEERVLETAEQQEKYLAEPKTKNGTDFTVAQNDYTEKLPKCVKSIAPQTKLMLLALKSVYFLTDRHIYKLSLFTGFSRKEIENKMKHLNALMKNRLAETKMYIERQNAEYIRIKKAEYIIRNFPEGCVLYRSAVSARKFHTKRWKTQTEKLRKYKKICPSNSQIAKVMNLNPSQITRILEAARKSQQE